MLTKQQLEEIRARADLVSNRIGKLASGKERFKMCIPPQPYDDDIAIATLARTDVPALLSDNDALRERNQKLERVKALALELLKSEYLEDSDLKEEIEYDRELNTNSLQVELYDAISALDAGSQTVAATVHAATNDENATSGGRG